jgi:hypothetical protein
MTFSQVEIISAILINLGDQEPECLVSQEQMNVIIRAADSIKAAMESEPE